MKNKMKRRTLLKGAATAALFAPVARFWTDIAEAQDIANAKRLICIALSNGMGEGGRFVEAAAGQPGGFTFRDGFEALNKYRTDALAILNNNRSAINYPFRDLLVNKGVTNINDTHASSAPIAFSANLSNSIQRDGASSPSVDQLAAWDYLKRGVINDPLRASLLMQLPDKPRNSGDSRTVFRAARQDRNYYDGDWFATDNPTTHRDPQKAWDLMFQGVMSSSDTGSTTTSATLFSQGKSMLDSVRGELASAQSMLPSEGRDILEQHVQSLRDLENSLADETPTTVPTGEIVIPPQPGSISQSNSNHAKLWSAFVQVGVAALRADRTRILGLEFGSGMCGDFTLPELNDDHHSCSHERPQNVYKFMEWYSARIIEFLDLMKGSAGQEDLLRSSATFMSCDHGDAYNHSMSYIPAVIFGDLRGYFNVGRMVESTGGQTEKFTHHTGLLLGLLHGMGCTSFNRVGFGPQLDQYGAANFHKGVWQELLA